MLPQEFLGCELIEKLVHLVGIDARLKTVYEDADLERRRRDRLLGKSKTDPEGFVDRGLQSLTAATNRAFEALSDIWVQGEGGSHKGIVMLPRGDVKMSVIARAASQTGRVRSRAQPATLPLQVTQERERERRAAGVPGFSGADAFRRLGYHRAL